MLIKMPDGMWLDPRTVKCIYCNGQAVVADVGSADDVNFYPADCKESDNAPEPTLQELADKIATLINNELGRRI